MSGLEIAIVGMAGRFPGARSVAELWRNLRAGVESIRLFTEEELRAAGVDPALLANPRYVRAGAVLDDIELFDAAFFGVPPREAELMDPQHRLFLECAWTALENAGHDPARFAGPVGVFGGASTNTYLLENLLKSGAGASLDLPTLFGNQSDYLTTRVSYKLDLRGPSVDVQTSCSSSLVAVHLACQALLAGECDLALAGGVNVAVPHRRGYLYQEQGIYSPDGHCRAFSARAQGTVGGNGVAVVVLRRLQDALDDGDPIRAVIAGSAVNNDGSDKVGFAAPSVAGQARVVRSALEVAEVGPESIGYVETHGTGTSLGDPIEIAALTEAFRSGTDAKGFCAIGSVKANIGHLDTAAGVTGLVKVTLALENRELPPSLNCDEPNPKIGFPETPFRVNTELTEWTSAGPRRAGVSSFGIGGTNAHVVVLEAPAPVSRPRMEPRDELFLFSARTKAALDERASDFVRHLRENPGLDLADVAWTLQVGRAGFEHGLAVVASDATDLARTLESRDAKRVRSARRDTERARGVAFLFPGQGVQHPGMGRGLYETERVFREEIDRAAEFLRPLLGSDLRSVLHPAPGREEEAAQQLSQTVLTQPALFAVEHALARLLMAWGIRPHAMIGHSLGEYVAATISGVFDFEDALALVAERGRLMQTLQGGEMLAVPLAAAELEPMLGEQLSLAAVNEHASCVASGPAEPIAALAESLRGRGVATRRLATSHAFHSAMMDPILDAFAERVRAATRRAPEIPFVSNLTGTWIRPEEATDPAYWTSHLRHTVRFAAGVEALLAEGHLLLEVGPGTTLSALSTRIARRVPSDAGLDPVAVASMRHPRESRGDRESLLDGLGRLWLSGLSPDWNAVRGDARRRRVPLPTYPFQGRRFWIDADPAAGRSKPALGKLADVAQWFYLPSWKRSAGPFGDAAPRASEVLVFSDRRDAGIARRLADAGRRTTTVRAGRDFAAADPADGAILDFVIRPEEGDDYRRLLLELEGRGRRPRAIFHLWAAEDGRDLLERGVLGLLQLARAIIERRWEEPLELVVATCGAHDVTGDESLSPEAAAIRGVAMTLAQEHPSVTCRTIDLPTAGPVAEERLLAELDLGAAEPVVALRGIHRWVQSFEPVRIEERAAMPRRLREGGHYIVTGGLGSVGLEVAEVLAREARAKLVLVGRSELPPRGEWSALVASLGADAEQSRRLSKILSLEALGAKVWTARADVTDREAMRALVGEAERRFGPLRGVVHAAGAEKEMALLADTTSELLRAQLHPKLEGLSVLAEVLAEKDLDFCIVQSSLSSFLGALGMAGYVAAHLALDAFVARHNRSATLPWTVVHWDNWLTWKEPESAHSASEGAYSMTPAEGALAFRRVLDLPAGTGLAVSTGDLSARVERWVGRAAREERPADSAARHARPDLDNAYVAARDPVEHALVRVWGAVLGIEKIGVGDGFFDLGGDSVLGLQVVAQLAEHGYRVTPRQIFEHPTIAELAAVAKPAEGPLADQGPATGSVPLVPIQRWFFELDLPQPDHFNLPMLLSVPEGAAPKLLGRALAAVLAHHDALRLRFVREGGAIRQVHADASDDVEVGVVDLSGTPEAEREAVMKVRATELHRTLDLSRGPLVRAVLFRFGPGRPPELLWIVHHLCVDAVSWRILLEDFSTALGQLRAGEPVRLLPKTTSFQSFAVALSTYAASATVRAEADGWRATCAGAPRIPTDADGGPNLFSSARTVSIGLDPVATRSLLQQVQSAYETRTDEVLLTALVLAFSDWTKEDTLLVDLEGHGREEIAEGLDLSRTVGWFTTLFPARLSIAGSRAPGDALMAIKEQVRRIPRGGIGFGCLRYLCAEPEVVAELRALPRPEVNFLYLGRFDTPSSTPARLLAEASGEPCSPAAPRGHVLEIVSYVLAGGLRVDFSYSEHRHRRRTVEALAERFQAELRALVAHCLEPEAHGRTPSDFPAARVSQADLNKLLGKLGRSGKGP